MGRKYARLCVGRGATCFRVHSLSLRSKPTKNPIRAGQIAEFFSSSEENSFRSPDVDGKKTENENSEAAAGNKILIVVDSSLEAKGAVEWTLIHAVQTQDTIILLHVTKPSNPAGSADSSGKVNLRDFQRLHSLKNMCQTKRPGVKVEVALMEGKEKGSIIVEEAKRQKVSLLVLGQKRKQSIWLQLMKIWSRNRRRKEVVEYCIQNASCMTIAVRRKSRKLGGYLITTKRHKNFWLLA
ncbi:uncharacterized protein LOC107419131 [Ziziphus jujuba]|uniref:Uncharacterized protein LOC107419131 n=2 Tax=Ziziphus jujuba TaxID=326968 RepID=A0A6P4ACL7_ZIZJJ|nr:uncharacterized protein LOC107419131 [Ziziphus jujuba]KAH7528901.1 hypothetical protein FEM48_Zijuj05G0127000 [Ziziphus jujuba var. spinosa]